MNDWLQFVDRKIGTALMLDAGQCNGSYSDACVLLSALISGIASELWPGKGIDRSRFVELWAQYSDAKLQPRLVSVPLLREFLRSQGVSEGSILQQAKPEMFGVANSSLILRGQEVDMPEKELLALQLPIPCKVVRAYTYPAIFYAHVRSNLTHEYKLSDLAASHFATRRQAHVSYVNRIDLSQPELSRRQIHFHMSWLAEITRSIATNVAKLIDSQQQLPRPKSWWVNG